MAGKLMRLVALLVKEETTQNTDSSPLAANAILARVSDAQPVMAEFADRQNAMPYLGNPGSVAVSSHSEITIEFELAGSASAGTVPGWAPLIKACGFSETVVAATSVTYKPLSTAFKWVTCYYYLDGLLHKMIGSVGNLSISLNSRSIPTATVKLTGLYSATADAAIPSGIDYSAFQAPQAVNKINTQAYTLGGVSVAFDTFSLDMNNNVVYRNMPTLEEAIITDRKPTGQISIQMTSVATKAWHSLALDGTLQAMSMTHGSGAGKVFNITAPKVQLTDPQYADKDGIVMLNFGMKFMPNVGNDELSIALT